LARVRVRQHVNPLSYKYKTPVELPAWDSYYTNPTQALHLDIGCARGKFLLQMAPLHPQINFLGVEIRQPLVNEANENCDRLKLSNLRFLYCNINNSLASLLASLPTGILQWVSIQFPDPWFKQRHMKRRVVQPELVNLLAQYLVEGGTIFLQSDVKEIAIEMRDRVRANPIFEQQHQETWLETNPFRVPTEREIATLNHQKPVYRALFQKKI
jgi:tRNA (guanine-N7-)-methyltransferase